MDAQTRNNVCKNNWRAAHFLLAIAYSALLACGSPRIPVVEQVPVPQVDALPPNVVVRPLILDRVIIDVPRGTVLGETRHGRLCSPLQPRTWEADTVVARQGDFHREFEKVVVQYKYRLADKPTSLFEEPKLSGAELVVAAKITNIRENNCFAAGNLSFEQVYLGNVRFSVHWEVYSVLEKKVVLSLDNEGSAMVDEFKRTGEDSYYPRAFGNALRSLLKNADFLHLVTSDPKIEMSKEQEDRLLCFG